MGTRHPEDVHVPFIVASLVIGVFGGFTLAVSLPVEAALGRIDAGWLAHAQAHGHLQVVGFAGLFVIGMALKLGPRFAGRASPAFLRLVMPGLTLSVAGLLMRAIAQPLASHSPFGGLLIAGAVTELAGAALLSGVLASTMWRGARRGDPSCLFLTGTAVWLLTQAALGAWWLTELALEAGTILDATKSAALVHLQLFGVILAALLGVGFRSFPTFFGAPPPHVWVSLTAFALLTVGLALWTVGGAIDGPFLSAVAGLGRFEVGAAIFCALTAFGLGRRGHRLAPASRGYIWALRPVMGWLTVTGGILIWSGTTSLVTSDPASIETLDALRHVFAIGVVTLAIIGMAQLILPEFASERLVGHPAPWRGVAFGSALSIAAALRGLVPLSGLDGEPRWWLMALAGIIALMAIAVFGLSYWRARRGHVAYMARMAAMRARGPELRMVGDQETT